MLKGKTGRVFFSRLFEGEDLAEAIKKRVEESGVKAGFFLLIGSLKDAVLGYYKSGQYKTTRLEGPLEIASCMGNIAVDENGEVMVHAHVVVSNEDGEAFGGHVMKDSHVSATAELVIVEAKGVNLQRVFDEKTGLKLLKLG
ncbi:MAG: DNA-binding protein [Candidatus Bathyarchaeota archaeon]|nr:DNA-binding protein [Candidatus Bathyarchaeota archaeon]